MEGELKKWVNILVRYQQRYCVILGDVFYYYNNKGEEAKGKVHLGISKLEDRSPDSDTFELDSGSNYYYFKANSIDDKKKWVNAIKEAKFNANRPKNKNVKKKRLQWSSNPT